MLQYLTLLLNSWLRLMRLSSLITLADNSLPVSPHIRSTSLSYTDTKSNERPLSDGGRSLKGRRTIQAWASAIMRQSDLSASTSCTPASEASTADSFMASLNSADASLAARSKYL